MLALDEVVLVREATLESAVNLLKPNGRIRRPCWCGEDVFARGGCEKGLCNG